MKLCSVDNCNRKHKCRRFCAMHYKRYWRHGNPHALKWSPKRLPRGHAARNKVLRIYKSHAQERELDWLLTNDQAFGLFERSCFYCGAEQSNMCSEPGNFNGAFRYNGIDRLNNDLGYMIGNVVPCCKDCNVSKGSRELDEFLIHAHNITQKMTKYL